jgi:competence protein ComEA
VLPLPRRRLDADDVRARLRRLAGLDADDPVVPFASSTSDAGDEEPVAPVVVGHASLRAVAVAVALTALAAWLLVRVTSGGAPSEVQVVPGTPLPSSVVASIVARPSANAPSPTAAASASSVVVQVVGAVVHPGLVTLATGSRVADAIVAAGGLSRRGASGGLNLARVLVDGEQVVVSPSTPAEGGAVSPPASSGGSGAGSGVVDLNSATATDLDALPGVGPVMASRILDWRTAHGRFASVDQLREVSGIGARTFERLKPHVRV